MDEACCTGRGSRVARPPSPGRNPETDSGGESAVTRVVGPGSDSVWISRRVLDLQTCEGSHPSGVPSRVPQRPRTQTLESLRLDVAKAADAGGPAG
jgi:hypothetical protein